MEAPVISADVLARYAGVDVVVERVGAPRAKQ